jgi:hypothetical protein
MRRMPGGFTAEAYPANPVREPVASDLGGVIRE